MKHNLLKSLIISVILLMGVSNAWGWWYVPGTIHQTRWDKADNNMHEDNAITFYAVPAGTYEFQLTNGDKWSGNSCISSITGATKSINGSNAQITTSSVADITITVVDEKNWKVSVTVTPPTYHIKAPWNGTDWSWKEFHDQGDGTYSLQNTYTNSTQYNYIKISSDEETAKYYRENATLVNSPSSTSDNCIYTFNPSNGSLEIRKCNTVKFPYHIYFDNSIANWPSDKLQFVVGHASYGRGHVLTSIANTKLYHVHITNWNWPDAGYYAIVSEPNTFGEDGWSRKNLTDNADHYSKAYLDPLNIEQNQSYLFKTENANNGTPISITKKTKSSELNTTQTVQYVIAEYAGTPAIMNSGSTPGKISISSYKFIDGTYDAVSSVSANLAAQSTKYSTSFNAAQTATTTLEASELDEYYQFDGWYSAATEGEPLSTNTTYTYYPTTDQTIYARFSKRPLKVTLHPIEDSYGNSGYGSFTVKYNDELYTSKPNETVIFEVAPGSTITIVESQHNYPEIFNGDLAWKKSGDEWTDDNYLSDPKNYQLTVISDIEIAENFCVRDKTVKDKNLHLFLKIPKSLDKKIDGTEVGWRDNDSNDGDAAAGYSEKAEDCANFVWLGIAFFDERIKGSTLEERGCIGTEQPEGSYLMKPLLIEDNYYNYYYCTITDSCWFNVKFERKHADSDAGLPQLMAAEVQRFPGDGKVCFTITGYDNDRGFVGVWEEAPKCKVKVNYPDMGKYGVEYNGEMHYATSSPRHTEIFYVPFKSQIKIFEGEHNNPAYTKTVAIVQNGAVKQRYEFSEQNKSYTHTVIGDVTFDDLFTTKQEYDVYIGVADEGLPQPWYENGMYLYYDKPYGPTGTLEKIEEINIDDYTYYRFRLPEGVAFFDFRRKTAQEGNTIVQTINHHSVLFPNVNCFILEGGQEVDRYIGHWISMPSDGDFRILYVEQIVTKKEKVGDEWITEVKRTYEHSSDLIKPQELEEGDKIVSLHIYTRGNNPEIILQQYDADIDEWIDIEAHMVNGPLETDDPGMGLLPGRKNASPGSEIDDFVYDDGIEKIKNDDEDDGCGVWNFTVKEDGNKAKLDLENGLERYTGKYYIRTDNAEGRWSDYTMPGNHMTYSAYAKKHSGFSHYFCKWLDIDIHFKSVSFIVANDYAHNLTDPSYLFDDQYIDDQWLPENANVRWGWDIVTNKVSRAYIQGTWTTAEPPARIHNLVLDYKPTASSSNKTVLLHDSGDWIYAINLTDTKVGSHLNSLTAKYPSTHISPQVFAEDIDMITGDNDNDNTYTVRVQYDFKIDHTLVALLPNDKNANIGIDVVIERTNNNEDATQVLAPVTSKKTQEDGSTGSTVYGVFTFTKKFLTADDKSYTNQERFTHWFSFPFDVKLSDVFGFSPVGDYWMIRKYNGDKRAEEGLNETNTFWEYELDPNATLEANKGYILVLSTYLKQPNRDVYTNRDTLSLYFPATNLVTGINKEYLTTEVEVPQHQNPNTTIKDWNWNMIGMPSYANKQETITQDHLYYFYDYSHKTNSYEVVWSGEKAFKSTFAYMVQFAGTIDWTRFNFAKAQGLAPRERTDEEIQKHVLRLDLQRAGAREDKTYIQLIDENATTDFDMNLDLTKMLNSSKSNLYSLLNNHRLAANVLPIEETIIPLGVVTTTAGEYTFAMPNGTDGIVVELIDYETNTRTNMLLDNYTVNLGKGTFENRFALHVKPDKTTTSVDNLGNEATGDKVKKYLIDGVLYMQKDGVLYDAQGRKL